MVQSIAGGGNGKREGERETQLYDRALRPRKLIIRSGRSVIGGAGMHILLVEDNEHHIFFVREVLKRIEKPIV